MLNFVAFFFSYCIYCKCMLYLYLERKKKNYIKKKKKKKVSHRVERVAMNMNLISPFMMGGLSIFNTSVVLEHKLQLRPPPPHLIKGGWQYLKKIESLGAGVPKILLERGDNPEKGELMQKWGGFPLFYYFNVQQHYCVWWGKVTFPLLYFGSSVF